MTALRANVNLFAVIIFIFCTTSLLSCRFWERKLLLAYFRAKNQAKRSRPEGAGSALTALIGGARAKPERTGEQMLNSDDRTDGRRPSKR